MAVRNFHPPSRKKKISMMKPTPTMNASILRLHALSLIFGTYVGEFQPVSFSDIQWMSVKYTDKPLVVLLNSIENDLDEIGHISFKIHRVYDFYIHLVSNYPLHATYYRFNWNSLFRWWTDSNAPRFSPISNVRGTVYNTRRISVPLEFVKHPIFKALMKSESTHGILLIQLSKYFALLVKELVGDDKMHEMLCGGLMGSSRRRLGKFQSVREFNEITAQVTKKFLEDLDKLL